MMITCQWIKFVDGKAETSTSTCLPWHLEPESMLHASVQAFLQPGSAVKNQILYDKLKTNFNKTKNL